jgi:hypothetical protein
MFFSAPRFEAGSTLACRTCIQSRENFLLVRIESFDVAPFVVEIAFELQITGPNDEAQLHSPL